MFRLFMILAFLFLSILVKAQEEAIPLCTDEQITILEEIVEGFVTGMPDENAELSTIGQWQRDFWADIEALEVFPGCAEALRALPIMGRIADNVLIVKLATMAGESDLADLYAADTEGALTSLAALAGADTVATAQPTPDTPEIVSFSVSPTIADRGDTLTISWDIRGADTVNIYYYHPLQRFPGSDAIGLGEGLPPQGTITFTVPNAPITGMSFSPLWPPSGEQAITVTIRCPYEFFVTPQSGSNPCPIDDVALYPAAYQPFERGFMVWHSGYVWFFADTGRGGYFVDEWVEGDIIIIDEQPPPGFIKPHRGFGKIWAAIPAVRDSLGWATEPEQAYTTRYQDTQVSWNRLDFYLTLPDERVVYLRSSFNSYTWEYVP